jgi:hypothetical protein
MKGALHRDQATHFPAQLFTCKNALPDMVKADQRKLEVKASILIHFGINLSTTVNKLFCSVHWVMWIINLCAFLTLLGVGSVAPAQVPVAAADYVRVDIGTMHIQLQIAWY